MKTTLATIALMLALMGTAFARNDWKAGYLRAMPDPVLEKQITEAMANGYHIPGAGVMDGSTCIGGDEHNAPLCDTDAHWYRM